MPRSTFCRPCLPSASPASCAAIAAIVVLANSLAMNQAAAKFTGSQPIVSYGFPPNIPPFQPLYATSVPSNDPGSNLLAIAGKTGAVDFLDLSQPVVGDNLTNVTRILELPIDDNFLFDSTPGLYTRNDSGLHGLAFHPDFTVNGKFYINATFDNSVVDGAPFLELMGLPTGVGDETFDPSNGYSAGEVDLINATLTDEWNQPAHGLVPHLFWSPHNTLPQASLNMNGELRFVSQHPNPDVNSPSPAHHRNPGYVEVREYTSAGGPVDPDAYRLVLRYEMNFEFHNGGWIDFGPDGCLYITTGDSTGNPINHLTAPDDPTVDWHGKVLRIDVDGEDAYLGDEGENANRNYAVPPDNPFADGPSPFPADPDETAKAVWAYGLRHPWRASFDAATGDLWVSDVGFGDPLGSTQSVGVEEVNFLPAGVGGANFGWPYFEGNIEFEALGPIPPGDYTAPAHSYEHIPPDPDAGLPGDRGAITGGFVYRGSDPALRGKYLYVDSNRRELWMFDPSDPAGTAEDISSMIFTPDKRWLSNNAPVGVLGSFGQDSRGNLYLTDTASNTVYRLITSGDFNGDGVVDFLDVDLLAEAARLGSVDPLYDLDEDGSVTFFASSAGVSSDSDYLIRAIVNSEYGDANLDGYVDILDFDLFGQGWLGAGTGWLFGDFDASGGPTDIIDFDIFGQFYGFSPDPAATAVPESKSVRLAALACFALLLVHFKRGPGR
jgi:glucose/arabinose dehydrogenase